MNKQRFLEAVKRGYSFCEAQNIWAAKIAVDMRLGEFRIGRRVMYKPDADIEVNRALRIRIEAVQA